MLAEPGDGPKKQLKDPSNLAEVPTVSTTTSIHLKGFPKPEVSIRKEMEPVRKGSASARRARNLRLA